MKKIFTLLSLIASISIGSAQVYNQTNVFSTGGNGLHSNRAIDSQGNYYTIGFLQGSFTYGAETATYAGGNADVFLTKTSPTGVPLWAKSFTGLADNVGTDVTIDSNDNIYITGYFQGSGPNSFDADPGPFQFLLAAQSTVLSRDCFVIKLNSNAEFVWAKQFSNSFSAVNEVGKGIRVDSAGNVYVFGDFLVADFDPSSTANYVLCANNDGTIITTQEDCGSNTSLGNSIDNFLVKLDTNGNLVWAKQLRSLGTSSSQAIGTAFDMDSQGNLYLSGRFNQTIDLDPSANEALFTTTGNADIYLVKLDNNGNYIWGKSFGSTAADEPARVYAANNKVYLCGNVSGATDFDPTTGTNIISINGLTAAFVSIFDDAGNYNTTYVIDGADSSGRAERIFSAKVFNDKLYLAGVFDGTPDFDVTPNGVVNTTTNGSGDTFLLAINKDTGAYIEHFTIGGAGSEEYAWADINNGFVFFAGSFKSASIDFNPFAGTDIQLSQSPSTCFISTFTPNAVLSNDTFSYENSISVYPNPAVNDLNVNMPFQLNAYEIYTVEGKLIKKNSLKSNQIPVSELSTGTYIIKFIGDNFTHTKKFIKK